MTLSLVTIIINMDDATYFKCQNCPRRIEVAQCHRQPPVTLELILLHLGPSELRNQISPNGAPAVLLSTPMMLVLQVCSRCLSHAPPYWHRPPLPANLSFANLSPSLTPHTESAPAVFNIFVCGIFNFRDTRVREVKDRLSCFLSPIIRDTSRIIKWHLESGDTIQSWTGRRLGEGGSAREQNLSTFIHD